MERKEKNRVRIKPCQRERERERERPGRCDQEDGKEARRARGVAESRTLTVLRRASEGGGRGGGTGAGR